MRPLSNLTVLDLTVNTPGPFCSMILSDLGARVIKIEPPGGDPLRKSSASMFAGMNRGKESISLNLKSDGDRDVLLQLVERADIVLEGSRPGVAQRLGADYETLREESRHRVLLDLRLRTGRPLEERSRPRCQLPCRRWLHGRADRHRGPSVASCNPDIRRCVGHVRRYLRPCRSGEQASSARACISTYP